MREMFESGFVVGLLMALHETLRSVVRKLKKAKEDQDGKRTRRKPKLRYMRK